MTGIVAFVIAIILLALLLLLAGSLLRYRPHYISVPIPAVTDGEAWFRYREEEDRKNGVRPGNESRLVRYGKYTDIAFLYIHGFTASRAEGEEVMDRVAGHFRANTWYLRLPGHGTTPEEFAETTSRDVIAAAEEALFMASRLGRKLIVVGTSMGGALATYLAGEYSHRMAGLILTSPFYNFASPLVRPLNIPIVRRVFEAFMPVIDESDPDLEEGDNWSGYWYEKYYSVSVRLLTDIRRLLVLRRSPEMIHVPVLMFYYKKSGKEMDDAASVAAMLSWFSRFGGKKGASPMNRAVRVEQGNHVLMSRHYDSDKDLIFREIVEFVSRVTEEK
jgi:pimeloyl-ACP methyl ester carboxylesterase